jgi:hypothetical protein
MFIGLLLILSPFTFLFSSIPFLGPILNFAIYFLAFFFTLILATLVIATAYIFYRPLIAIPILAVTLTLFIYSLLSVDREVIAKAFEDHIKTK